MAEIDERNLAPDEVRDIPPEEMFDAGKSQEEISQEDEQQEKESAEKEENLNKDLTGDEKEPEKNGAEKTQVNTPEKENTGLGFEGKLNAGKTEIDGGIKFDKEGVDGKLSVTKNGQELNVQQSIQNLQKANLAENLKKLLIYLLLGGPAMDLMTGGMLRKLVNGELFNEEEKDEINKALVTNEELEKSEEDLSKNPNKDQGNLEMEEDLEESLDEKNLEEHSQDELGFKEGRMDDVKVNEMEQGAKAEGIGGKAPELAGKNGGQEIPLQNGQGSMKDTPQGINVPQSVQNLQQADISEMAKKFLLYMLLGGPLTDIMTGGMLHKLINGDLFAEEEKDAINQSIITNEEYERGIENERTQDEIGEQSAEMSEDLEERMNEEKGDPEEELGKQEKAEETREESEQFLEEDQQYLNDEKAAKEAQTQELNKQVELEEKQSIHEGRVDLGMTSGVVASAALQQEAQEMKMVQENPEMLSQTSQTPAMIAVADGMDPKEAVMQYGAENGTRTDMMKELGMECSEKEAQKAIRLDEREGTDIKLESLQKQQQIHTREVRTASIGGR